MKTNIRGYFNGNDWPIRLSISERNRDLHVEPGQHVRDDRGNLVNDPILERYVVKNGLSREVVPVESEVVMLTAQVNPVAAVARERSSPVLQATGFSKDAHGRLVPEFAAKPPAAAPIPPGTPGAMTVNQPGSPVRAYTLEQAQAVGLTGKIKPLPEDFGAPETGSGVPAPANQLPELKLPTEARRVPPPPLPAELVSIDEKMDPARAAAAKSLQASLSQAAQSNPDAMPVRSVAPTPVPARLTTPVVPPVTEAQVLAVPAKPASQEPKRQVAHPLNILNQPLPQPDLEGITANPDGTPVSPPSDDPPASAPSSAHSVVTPAVEAYKCPVCSGGPFSNRGLFTRHVRRYHRNQEAELMAGCPMAA